MSRYPGAQDRRSLEYRLDDLERQIKQPGVEVVRTVFRNTSEITSSGPSRSTDLDAHVRAADPHSQYYLESEASSLEGRVLANEGDIAALDGRVTTLEADVLALQQAQARTLVEVGDPFVIPAGRQVIVFGALTVEGEMTVNGELVSYG